MEMWESYHEALAIFIEGNIFENVVRKNGGNFVSVSVS